MNQNIQTILERSDPLQQAAMGPMRELSQGGLTLAGIVAACALLLVLVTVFGIAVSARRATMAETTTGHGLLRLVATVAGVVFLGSFALALSFATVERKVDDTESVATVAYRWKLDTASDISSRATGMGRGEIQTRLDGFLAPVAADAGAFDPSKVRGNAAYAVERGVAYSLLLILPTVLLVLGPILGHLISGEAIRAKGRGVALGFLAIGVVAFSHFGPAVAAGVVDVEAVPAVTEGIDRFTKAAARLGPAMRDASDDALRALPILLYKPNYRTGTGRTDGQGNSNVERVVEYMGTNLVRPLLSR